LFFSFSSTVNDPLSIRQHQPWQPRTMYTLKVFVAFSKLDHILESVLLCLILHLLSCTCYLNRIIESTPVLILQYTLLQSHAIAIAILQLHWYCHCNRYC